MVRAGRGPAGVPGPTVCRRAWFWGAPGQLSRGLRAGHRAPQSRAVTVVRTRTCQGMLPPEPESLAGRCGFDGLGGRPCRSHRPLRRRTVTCLTPTNHCPSRTEPGSKLQLPSLTAPYCAGVSGGEAGHRPTTDSPPRKRECVSERVRVRIYTRFFTQPPREGPPSSSAHTTRVPR